MDTSRFCEGLPESWGRRAREKLGVDIYLNVVKNGRKVIGYEMQITDNRQPITAEVIQQAKEDSYQTDIYDFLD